MQSDNLRDYLFTRVPDREGEYAVLELRRPPPGVVGDPGLYPFHGREVVVVGAGHPSLHRIGEVHHGPMWDEHGAEVEMVHLSVSTTITIGLEPAPTRRLSFYKRRRLHHHKQQYHLEMAWDPFPPDVRRKYVSQKWGTYCTGFCGDWDVQQGRIALCTLQAEPARRWRVYDITKAMPLGWPTVIEEFVGGMKDLRVHMERTCGATEIA